MHHYNRNNRSNRNKRSRMSRRIQFLTKPQLRAMASVSQLLLATSSRLVVELLPIPRSAQTKKHFSFGVREPDSKAISVGPANGFGEDPLRHGLEVPRDVGPRVVRL